MADQHDGELAAALRHEFGEALEGGQCLGVEVVSVVDEKRDRLLGSPEQLLQVALTALGLAGDRDRLLRRQIVEQRREQQG